MKAVSRYWKLFKLDGRGKLTIEDIFIAKTFFDGQFPDSIHQTSVSDSIIQHQLFTKWRNNLTNHQNAQICLRCFISNQIEQICLQFEYQFGNNYGFSRHDLYPFILDDTLDDVIRNRTKSQTYISMAVKILQSFDPSQASLQTWTTRLVKQNRELNNFLLERGVYLASDWAILNDTTPKQLCRILTQFHQLSESEIQPACRLLESYHAVYRRDRLVARQLGSIGKCLSPSVEQLQNIATLIDSNLLPEKILSQLQTLAERLRQYRIQARGGVLRQDSLENTKTRLKVEQQQCFSVNHESDAEKEQAIFLRRYRRQFLICLDQVIAQITQTWVSRQKPQKVKEFLIALELFHCQGQSMTEIAQEIGLQAQYQVTRLLKLKEFRADIGQTLLKQLSTLIPEMAHSYTNPDLLLQQEQQIQAALDEQITTLLQDAATDASTAKHHTAGNLFAQRLCHYLQQLKTL